MSFQYSQSTGVLLQDGDQIGVGYSGNGIWLNDPNSQNVHAHGPLPQGQYTICQPTAHPKLGPVAMALMPYNGNTMFLRGDFFIHGPHANDQHDSSDGCIVISLSTRVAIAEAVVQGDNELIVTA